MLLPRTEIKRNTSSTGLANVPKTTFVYKPTGAPMFEALDSIKSEQKMDHNRVTSIADMSTNETDSKVTIRQFVIGKKVENTVGLNRLDIEGIQEEQIYPVKVLYVKPTKRYDSVKVNAQITGEAIINENKENAIINGGAPRTLKIKKEFIKGSSVDTGFKISEKTKAEHVQTNPAQTKNDRNKLGSIKVKPQISYMKKVVERPKSALSPTNKNIKLKPASKPDNQANDVIDEPKARPEIPFANNRFQGKFKEIKIELAQKAKQAIKEEKEQENKQKLEQKNKKEKEKQVEQEFRQRNKELVEKQKEKGGEMVNPRQKEEAQKQKEKNDENNLERQQRRNAREERNKDKKKQLGLDIFDEKELEEIHQRLKQDKERQLHEQNTTIASTKPQKVHKIKKVIPTELKGNIIQTQKIQQNFRALSHAQQQIQLKEIQKEEEAQQNVDKHQILVEQQKKRKQKQLEQQRMEQENAQKILDNMKALENNMKKQKEEYREKKLFEDKIKQEQERLRQQMADQSAVMNKKKKHKKKDQQQKVQFEELHDWIEQQCNKDDDKEDKLNAPKDPIQVQINYSKSQGTGQKYNSQNKNVVLDDYLLEEENDVSLQPAANLDDAVSKFQLPGNHLLSEEENNKLGARQNRYGVFGDNGYSEEANNYKQKLDIKNEIVEVKHPPAKQVNQKDIKRVKDHIKQKINEIAGKQNAKVIQNKDIPDNDNITDKLNHLQNLQGPKKTKAQELKRQIIVDKVNPSHQDKSHPPGIVNIQSQQNKLDQEEKKKNTEAAIVMQKWARGWQARHKVRLVRLSEQKRIEQEYGQFDSSVKFNRNYNLEQFLHDKHKIKQNPKAYGNMDYSVKLIESAIAEKIGESQDSARHGISYSQKKHNTKFQNFMAVNNTTEYDPLSLIGIYARKQMRPSEPGIPLESPRVLPKQSAKKPQAIKAQHKVDVVADNDIDEDIYQSDFDDAATPTNKQLSTSKSIMEEIIQESKGHLSSSESVKGKKNYLGVPTKKMPFGYKPQHTSSVIESIKEEEHLGSRNVGASHQSNGSIEEESYLKASASKSSQRSAQKQKHRHQNKDEYEEEEFDSYQESHQNLKQSGRNVQPLMAPQQQQMNQNEGSAKKKDPMMLNLLEELQKFEQASMNTVFVERLEKMMLKNIASKDKIILAQRLHELEQEKKHKDEINHIKEEQLQVTLSTAQQQQQQISLLTQLLLSGGNMSGLLAQEDKDKIQENIKQILSMPQQPIIIQQVYAPAEESKQMQSSIKQKNNLLSPIKEQTKQLKANTYSEQSYQDDFIAESRTASVLQGELKKPNKVEDSIKESIQGQHQHHDDDQIDEDIEIGASTEKEDQSQDEIKESVYVNGNKTEADKPKINASKASKPNMKLGGGLKKPASEKLYQEHLEGLFEKHSFKDFTMQKFMELLQENIMSTFMKQIEQTLDKKKEHDQQEIKYQQQHHHQPIIKYQEPPRTIPDSRYKSQGKIEASASLEESEVGYSMSYEQYEESIGKSQQQLASPHSKQQQQNQNIKVIHEEENEDDRSSHKNKRFTTQQQQQYEQSSSHTPAVDNSADIEEDMIEASQSQFTSSIGDKKMASSSQNQMLIKKSVGIEEDLAEGSQSAYASSVTDKKMASSSQNYVVGIVESDDKEIFDSYGKSSVDWQINLESARLQQLNQKQSQVKTTEENDEDKYEDEEFEQISEQLQSTQKVANNKEEIDNLDDLDSVPEDMVDESQNDQQFQDRADRITDEFLEMLMDEMETDPNFILQNPELNEKDFQAKFPFILEKKMQSMMDEDDFDMNDRLDDDLLNEEMVKPLKPTPIQIPQINQVKIEIKKDQKYEEQQKQIQQIVQHVDEYIDQIVHNMNMREISEALDQPLNVEPIKVLARIQALDNDVSVSVIQNDETQQNTVLPLELYMDLERKYPQNENQDDKIEFKNAHHKAIFDAFNEALDFERPYKYKGTPMPWSKTNRVVKLAGSAEERTKEIIKRAKSKVLNWAKTGAGTKFAPAPPPPPPSQDNDALGGPAQPQAPVQTDEERKTALREERLGELLTKEIEENDNLWIDYENEETQVKFDLADMILEELANEAAEFLNALKKKP